MSGREGERERVSGVQGWWRKLGRRRREGRQQQQPALEAHRMPSGNGAKRDLMMNSLSISNVFRFFLCFF